MRFHGVAILCAVVTATLFGVPARSEVADQSQRHKTWYWSKFQPDAVGPAAFTRGNGWVLAENIFFHGARFYSPSDASITLPASTRNFDFSFNTPAVPLPARNLSAFYHNLCAGWVEGTTLWVDVPFPSYSDHLGHWVETLAPLYSHLASGVWLEAVHPAEAAPPDPPYVRTVLIPALHRAKVAAAPWAMQLLALAVAPALPPGRTLPRVLFWDDLEAVNTSAWLGFERALRVYSKYDHPEKRSPGFTSPQLAAAFRQAAYTAANVSLAASPPRTVTFLMGPSGSQPIANNAEVLDALREGAAQADMQVRVYSASAGVALPSLTSIMASTGVLVGRNGPLLGAAVLLPPGAAVIELLPYNWESAGRDAMFVNLTRSVGDVAHVAWRAQGSDSMVYASDSDARYGAWNPEECSSKPCLLAQQDAAIKVDTAALRGLAAAVAAAVVGRLPPEEVRRQHPWPRGHERTGETGLWWDVK